MVINQFIPKRLVVNLFLLYLLNFKNKKKMLEIKFLRVELQEELDKVREMIVEQPYKSSYLEGVEMGYMLSIKSIDIAIANRDKSDMINEILD
tara:strand:- start:4284 stop:4562 length:279 start_codon:yes stop_codon:yes gene_type:complete